MELPPGDVTTLENCATLEEFLGIGEGLVADVVDVSFDLFPFSALDLAGAWGWRDWDLGFRFR
jgi:hypothetical protein